LARGKDVVVTQPQRVDVGWGLHRSDARVIYDLYVPTFVETIAQLGAETGDPQVRAQRLEANRLEYSTALQLGDAFICASDRQRDLWLGALGEAGRLDLSLIRRDPQTEQLIGIVPFGVSDSPPPPLSGPGPIHGALVPADATALLWTGGLWNWFDPLSVLEGLAQARVDDPNLHLVVMGMRHPDPSWEEQAASRDLRQRSGELGLLAPGGGVVLLEGWVPYAERHRYLLDADAAVSSHFDTVETRFSFRTRFLDHLWCGLPTFTTPRGEVAEAMIAAGAAEPVAEGDSAAWARSLRSVALDPGRLARMGASATSMADAIAGLESPSRWHGSSPNKGASSRGTRTTSASPEQARRAATHSCFPGCESRNRVWVRSHPASGGQSTRMAAERSRTWWHSQFRRTARPSRRWSAPVRHSRAAESAVQYPEPGELRPQQRSLTVGDVLARDSARVEPVVE
jgi:glycosyltransferase involved in cell wall biosynthesis